MRKMIHYRLRRYQMPILMATAALTLYVALVHRYFDSSRLSIVFLIIIGLSIPVVILVCIILIGSAMLDVSKENRDIFNEMYKRLPRSPDHSSGEIVRVYENQAKLFAEYSSIISEATKQIYILGTTLASLTWMPEFKVATTKAVKRGVDVRVLILNENAESIGLLAKQESRVPESYHAEIRETLRVCQSLTQDAMGHVEGDKQRQVGIIKIRLYNELPRSFLLVVDDLLFFRPYWFSGAYSSPCFQVKGKAGVIFRACEFEFLRLWDSHQTVTPQNEELLNGP